jgi:hypothetical protein
MTIKTNRIPSGSVDSATPATVTSLGADEFMTRPPDYAQLKRSLAGLLGTTAA